MAITYNDYLRLDVEVPTDGLPNLVQNPSGDRGTWGWITPIANTALQSPDGTYLHFSTSVTQAAHFTTEAMPVAASKYVSARFTLGEPPWVRARFEWLDSSKTLISSSTQTANLVSVGTYYTTVYQAPANTAYVRLRFDMYGSSGGANPTAGTSFTVTDVMVTWSDTSTVASERTNLVPNPSFEGPSTTGWSVLDNCTIAASSTQAFTGTYSLRLTTTANASFTRAQTATGTSGMPVVGGETYTIFARFRAATTAKATLLGVRWYDSAGTFVGAYTYQGTNADSSGWIEREQDFTAPSNAAYASVNMGIRDATTGLQFYVDTVHMERASTFTGYFSGATADAGGIDYAWTGTANNSTSTATSTSSAYEFSEPYAWQNILGPTHEININRDGFDVGLMNATVYDALLDPSVADTIRPGKKVRVQTLDQDEWHSIFEGTLTGANVTYDKKTTGTGQLETCVTITASDGMAQLANQGENRGVATMSDLAYLLEGKGVPWSIDGSGTQPTGSPTVVAYNENASVVDQIAITRDTNLAYAFVANNGVLTTFPTGADYFVNAGFQDDPTWLGAFWRPYTDIDVSFSTEECINSVMINFLRYDIGTGQTTEIPYGPYENADSIAQWGARTATFTIQAATEDAVAIAAYADDILTANATPAVKVNGLTFRVNSEDMVNLVINLDLMYKVPVYFQGTEYEPRINSIEHKITPEGWDVTLGFNSGTTVAAPTWTPSPPFNGVNLARTWQERQTGGALNITSTTFVDVPGATQVVTANSADDVYLVTVTLDCAQTTTNTQTLVGYLNIDAADETGNILYRAPAANNRATVSNTWLITGLSAGNHTFKVRANATGACAYVISPVHSNITIVRVV